MVQQAPNNDKSNYPHKGGTYVKGLKHTARGVVDPAIFTKFRNALGTFIPATHTYTLGSGNFNIPMLLGGSTKLNGPQGAFAKSIIGKDPDQYGEDFVPPAPEVKSKEYATELVELYWASLLRDVPFAQYPGNMTAQAAAAELNGLKQWYAGPLDASRNVTPEVLFRGGGAKFGAHNNESWFAGQTAGPYLSQLCLLPCGLGALPVAQKYASFAPGIDYMTDFDDWFQVQQGIPTSDPIMPLMTPTYLHDGRGLAAYTHSDELYQAYFIAHLVLEKLQTPHNLMSPYLSYTGDKEFGTFGGPDIVATLGTVAKLALNAVWYQKWIVHLRHRPEVGGGILQMIKSGYTNPAVPGGPIYTGTDLDAIILNSQAVATCYGNWQSYLLSQAFPEGSPTHPAYPTGHGAVAGACITVLKFFYDGAWRFANPMVPKDDGSDLVRYQGADGGNLTLNGELHKLAHNISFGHGIHAGIHWRSDTDYSIRLGEAVALNYLQEAATKYHEKFSIDIATTDGTTKTIHNP